NLMADANNYLNRGNTREIGSQISTHSDLQLNAQTGNVNIRASEINSDVGTVLIKAAQGDVNIMAGQNTDSIDVANKDKSKGFLSSTTRTTHIEKTDADNVASNITGNRVLIGAGNNVNIQGSNVVSDTLTWVDAKNDINITAAENTDTNNQFFEVKKSGLMGTGGIGFMVGKTQNSLATDATATTHTGSLIASNAGDVKLSAGNTLNIVGSDVLAANNATLVADDVNIINETNRYTQTTEEKSKSSGLSVSLSGTVGNAANTIYGVVKQANDASDRGNDRLAAAYGTKAALTAVQAGQSLYTDLSQTALANQASQTSAIGVSVSVGSSKSQSNSTTTQTATQGSNVSAGNNLTIIARGDGEKDANGFATNGDVNVVGSNLS
ncbi:hemagglutinin repeat-containing protein, partial [Formosimonas limnophila]|uniref:hemagglutinin repeat-containing protein n=1 Tax=Formosimonas limnophila TaxID=1384487 RepID=UPI00167987B5